jgi:hypothetical protein
MSSLNPSDDLTPSETARLAHLEALAQRGLGTYVEVGNALTEIRDLHLYRGTHSSFEPYLRDRWRAGRPGHVLPPPPSEADGVAASGVQPAGPRSKDDRELAALAKACEQTLRALGAGDVPEIDIRLTFGRRGHAATPTREPSADPGSVGELVGEEFLPALRRLLTQAADAIADVAHRVEIDATEVNDNVRAQLADDLLTLDEELATLHALLSQSVDWDAELGRLLGGEIPPHEDDDAHGDE